MGYDNSGYDDTARIVVRWLLGIVGAIVGGCIAGYGCHAGTFLVIIWMIIGAAIGAALTFLGDNAAWERFIASSKDPRWGSDGRWRDR